MWNVIFGSFAAVALSALLARQFRNRHARQRRAPDELFGEAVALFQDARIEPGATAGSHRLVGRYRDLPTQVQTVVDTLAVRKLPSLWLMVTIPEPLPLTATFDLMMRPSGPTSFSNFDHLPDIMERPADFPEQAVLRTDDARHVLPTHVLAPHLEPFFNPRAKELLVTPKGIRMVIQLAEADRARYGVFRQAEFGEVSLAPALLQDVLDRLIAMRQSILDWHEASR